VTEYVPVNEPLTTARFGGLYGHWAPHHRDHRTFVTLLLDQLVALRRAAGALRAAAVGARILLTEDLGRTTGVAGTRSAVRFDNRRRWLTWDLATGRVGADHPLRRYLSVDPSAEAILDSLVEDPVDPDILGIDAYVTSDRFLDDRVERYPAGMRGGDGRTIYADVERVRVGKPYQPPFSRAITETWERYRLPLVIGEVQLGGGVDDRVAWWHEAWASARRARAAGIDLRAVTAWAAFGSFDWDSLLTRSAGHYEAGLFELDGSADPRKTELATVVRSVATLAEGPAARDRGWWRSPGRVLFTSS
jgi:dTDP-4-dehydrorhamnose reductase